jgi:hypothetical protein
VGNIVGVIRLKRVFTQPESIVVTEGRNVNGSFTWKQTFVLCDAIGWYMSGADVLYDIFEAAEVRANQS